MNTTTIRVSWTAPTSGATPTGYRIYYQVDGEQGSTDVGADKTEWLRGGFMPNRTYDININVVSLSIPPKL